MGMLTISRLDSQTDRVSIPPRGSNNCKRINVAETEPGVGKWKEQGAIWIWNIGPVTQVGPTAESFCWALSRTTVSPLPQEKQAGEFVSPGLFPLPSRTQQCPATATPHR